MDATEKRIRRIIHKNGGMIYEAKKNKIIGEFMCTKKARVCREEISKLEKKVKVVRVGGRVTATTIKEG